MLNATRVLLNCRRIKMIHYKLKNVVVMTTARRHTMTQKKKQKNNDFYSTAMSTSAKISHQVNAIHTPLLTLFNSILMQMLSIGQKHYYLH